MNGILVKQAALLLNICKNSAANLKFYGCQLALQLGGVHQLSGGFGAGSTSLNSLLQGM